MGEAPFDAEQLEKLRGVAFALPAADPWVQERGTKAHCYLDSARQAWIDHPDWMDFLDEDSPAADIKLASRDLYFELWAEALAGASRVLDVGCGIGRFTTLALDAGADVWGVDADLRSLRRCAWHSAGREGRLDLWWSSAHRLPELAFDLAIACEVLCYVPSAEQALAAIRERLVPGGTLLLSMEARWGWACSEDAPSDAVAHALGEAEVLDVAGDRWVRTMEADELRRMLSDGGFEVGLLEPTHYLVDGPLERILPEQATLEEILTAEAKFRVHPVWRRLNRVHTVIATRR